MGITVGSRMIILHSKKNIVSLSTLTDADNGANVQIGFVSIDTPGENANDPLIRLWLTISNQKGGAWDLSKGMTP